MPESVNLLDILNLVIFTVLAISLLVLFRVEKLVERPKVYMRALILVVMFIILIDEVNYLRITPLNFILYPFNYFALFSIYPLLYIYLRDMAFNGTEIGRPHAFYFFIVPLIVFLFFATVYYLSPLEIRNELNFEHLSNLNGNSKLILIVKVFVIFTYYSQVVFYLAKLYKLLEKLKQTYGNSIFETKIIRIIQYFIPVIVLYELLIVGFFSYFSPADYEMRVFELIVSLLFILFALYTAINHSVMLIQLRIDKFHSKIDKVSVQIDEPPRVPLKNRTNTPTETEMLEIKEILENYLKSSKIFLDTNLTIESLAKKLHIQSRKISIVINHIYNKNFHGFINDFRISEAIRLMKLNPTANFEELYQKVGFNSRSTFNRVFKSVTGKAPSEYFSSQ